MVFIHFPAFFSLHPWLELIIITLEQWCSWRFTIGLGHVAASIDRHNYAVVTACTFGHLAPKPYKVYTGYILFTYTCGGQSEVIQWDFKGLDNSPWQYGDFGDFLFEQHEKLTEGKVYVYKGTYKTFKAQAAQFDGEITEVPINIDEF